MLKRFALLFFALALLVPAKSFARVVTDAETGLTWTAENLSIDDAGTTSSDVIHLSFKEGESLTFDLKLHTRMENTFRVYIDGECRYRIGYYPESAKSPSLFEFSILPWTVVIDNIAAGDHEVKFEYVKAVAMLVADYATAENIRTVYGRSMRFNNNLIEDMSSIKAQSTIKYFPGEDNYRPEPDPAPDAAAHKWTDLDYDDSDWVQEENSESPHVRQRYIFDLAAEPDPDGDYRLAFEYNANQNIAVYVNGHQISMNTKRTKYGTNSMLYYVADVPGEFLKEGRNIVATYFYDRDYYCPGYYWMMFYAQNFGIDLATQQQRHEALLSTLDAYPSLQAEAQNVWTTGSQAYAADGSRAEYYAAVLGHLRHLISMRAEATDVLASIESSTAPSATKSEQQAALSLALQNTLPDFGDDITAIQAKMATLRHATGIAKGMTGMPFDFSNLNNHTADGLKFSISEDKGQATVELKKCDSDVLKMPEFVERDGKVYPVTYVKLASDNLFESVTDIDYSPNLRSISIDCLANITDITLPATLDGHVKLGTLERDLQPYNFKNITILSEQLNSLRVDMQSGELHLPHLTEVPAQVGVAYVQNSIIYIPEGSFHTYVNHGLFTDKLLVEGTGRIIHTGKISAGELGYSVLQQTGSLREVNRLVVDGGMLNTDDWANIKDMTNLIDIDLSGSSVTFIPDGQFRDCWGIRRAVLPETLTKINSNAFRGTYLSEITLPDALTYIANSAFEDCIMLTHIELPDALETLDNYAFYGCTSLADVKFGTGLAEIGPSSFYRTALTSVDIPGNVNYIREYAFEHCDQLTDVNIHEGVEKIGSSAFNGCDLRALALPSSVKMLDSGAFNNNRQLADIQLAEGLLYIYNDAFANNDVLTEIVLPSTLLKCERGPFDGCPNLRVIDSRSVAPPFTNEEVPVSRDYIAQTTLRVPEWGRTAYLLAPGWKDFINIEANDVLPQKIMINQDFHFTMTDEATAEYHPDIELAKSDIEVKGPTNEWMKAYGALTVMSRSHLNANSFHFISSPLGVQKTDTYDLSTPIIVNGEMRAEDVEMQFIVANDEWHYVCFPFDVRVSDIVPDNRYTDFVVRRHDGDAHAKADIPNAWQQLGPDDILEVGKGYIFRCYNKDAVWYAPQVYFTVRPLTTSTNRQAIFRSDDRVLTFEQHHAEFEHLANWNLVGNPFHCYYDSRFMQSEAPITVWDRYDKVYKAYSPVDDNYVISPSEAFFVQVPLDMTRMTLPVEGRQTTRFARQLYEGELNIHRAPAARAAAENASRTLVNLTLSDGTSTDQTRIVFNESATTDYEFCRDAAKMKGFSTTTPLLFTMEGTTEYAINERPLADGTVVLGAEFPAAGSFTIALQPAAQHNAATEQLPLTLIDRETGIRHQLTEEAPYTFLAAAAGRCLDRFVLVVNGVTGIDNIAGSAASDARPATFDIQGRSAKPAAKGVVVGKDKKRINL